jgi:hypothetical protein
LLNLVLEPGFSKGFSKAVSKGPLIMTTDGTECAG